MKKVVSLIIAACLLIMTAVVPASAFERSELFELASYVRKLSSLAGGGRIYSNESHERLQAAGNHSWKIYEDCSDEELEEIWEELCYALDNMYVSKENAIATCILADRESNENGWYSDEDWSLFEAKRSALKEALRTGDDKTMDNAFDDLMDTFNQMCLRNTTFGDVDNDGVLTVKDVTETQKHIVAIKRFTGAQVLLSGTDRGYLYNPVTVSNASRMQRIIVGMEETPIVNDSFYYTTDEFGTEINYAIFLHGYNHPDYEDYRYGSIVKPAIESGEYDF